MFDRELYDDIGECIKIDLKWLKHELKDLTNQQRCLILKEYMNNLKKYNIGMREFVSFIVVLLETND